MPEVIAAGADRHLAAAIDEHNILAVEISVASGRANPAMGAPVDLRGRICPDPSSGTRADGEYACAARGRRFGAALNASGELAAPFE